MDADWMGRTWTAPQRAHRNQSKVSKQLPAAALCFIGVWWSAPCLSIHQLFNTKVAVYFQPELSIQKEGDKKKERKEKEKNKNKGKIERQHGRERRWKQESKQERKKDREWNDKKNQIKSIAGWCQLGEFFIRRSVAVIRMKPRGKNP